MAILGRPININGVAYAHADVVVNVLGSVLVGVTAINYGDEQDIVNNYASGNEPVSVGFGQVNYEGQSITLEMGDVEKLVEIAPGGRIQNIPFFDIGVNFITEDGKLARHSLKACRFKGRRVDSSTGNTQLVETLPLHVSGIDYDAK